MIEYDYGLEHKIRIQYKSGYNGFTKKDLAEIIWKEYERFQYDGTLMDDFYYNIDNLSLMNVTAEKNRASNIIILKPQIYHYNE